LQRCYRDTVADWRRIGILLGCFGGLLGIVSSGMVHYNMGDQEVAMVFFLLMALGMRAADREACPSSVEPATSIS